MTADANRAGSPARASLRHAIARALGLAALTGFAAGSLAAPAPAPSPSPAPPGSQLPVGPLVQLIDTTESEDHADVSIQFSCSVRYISNTPVSHGSSTKITLRLGPDCGTQFGSPPPELPLVGGGGGLVTGARVDSYVPGEITLELTWSRDLDFVMAPTASGLGLRVRLLNTNQQRKGGAFVAEPQADTGYSVNLESSKEKIPRETVEAAAAQLQTQAYISETDIEDEHWYRLRAGPFATKAEADRVLQAALAAHPRAWIASGDESGALSAVERAGVQSAASHGPTDPALPDEERAKLLRDARAALEQQNYPAAIDLLTRLLRQPEYPARADAQELLGLARERAGQFAQAKAEYEEYLRRYPEGSGAVRVRSRLQALAAASISAKSMGEASTTSNKGWTLAGATAVSYQYGRDQTTAAGVTTTNNSINSALVYGDLLLRDRGDRYDFTARLDGGYTHNLTSALGGGSQDRLNAGYIEGIDKNLGITGRIGRQSLASQGVVGLFDGVYAGFQLNPKWTFSAAAGLPAYTGYSAVSSNQKFGTVTAEFDPFHQSWIFDAYLFDETNGSFTERRSVGLQTRYSRSGRTMTALVDYDIAFQQLNSATLIGNSKIGEYWVLGFDADYRRSPLLELSNALIGLSQPDLKTLEATYYGVTPAFIKQLALDRTATSETFVLSATRPLGERWQFTADIGAIELSGTPATAATTAPVGSTLQGFPGVEATLSTGLDKNASLQFSGSSLLQANDLHIFSARVDDSPTARSETLSWDARFVLRGNWRLGPRLSVEELNDPQLGGKQTLYLPQLRGDYTNRFSVFEVTGGYQIQNQQTLLQQQSLTGASQTSTVNQRSLYLTVAYRVRF